jgi:hypothetical protein
MTAISTAIFESRFGELTHPFPDLGWHASIVPLWYYYWKGAIDYSLTRAPGFLRKEKRAPQGDPLSFGSGGAICTVPTLQTRIRVK